MISYTVRIVFEDAFQGERFEDYLITTHIADVLAHGAQCAELFRMEGERFTLEVRYTFDTREAFARYEQESAPALRQDALRRIPPGAAMFERTLGARIVAIPPVSQPARSD